MTTFTIRQFPILQVTRWEKEYKQLGIPESIPWSIVAKHENAAKANHSQSLKTLAHGGGLDPHELLAVLQNKHWRDVSKLSLNEVWEQLEPLIKNENKKSFR